MRHSGHVQKWSSHQELRRIAVKWSGLLQDKPAFNHQRRSGLKEYRRTYQAVERTKVTYTWGCTNRVCTAPMIPLLSLLSPINYQRWLITWLITALNCLCSHGCTAIFSEKWWTWCVWQSWWLMVFVLLECVHLHPGSILREGQEREIAAVHRSLGSQFPTALIDCRVGWGEKIK